MSIENVSWVFKHSPYKLGSRLVHLALADKANDDHENELWMHQAKVAEMAKVSTSQVSRILRQMVADGYLELLEQGGGRGRPSRYRLIKKTPQYDGVSADPKPALRGVENPATAAPLPIANGSNQTEVIISRDLTDEQKFDLVWKHYPRKLARAVAFDAFKKVLRQGVTYRTLGRATVNYQKARTNQDSAYTMHGSTFFAKDRWRDYLTGIPAEAAMTRSRNPLSRGGPSMNDMYREAREAEAAVKEAQ